MLLSEEKIFDDGALLGRLIINANESEGEQKNR